MARPKPGGQDLARPDPNATSGLEAARRVARRLREDRQHPMLVRARIANILAARDLEAARRLEEPGR